MSALSDQLTGLGIDLDTLGTEIATQIQQVVDAHNDDNETEFNAAVEALQGIRSRVAGFSTTLAADNPAPPA